MKRDGVLAGVDLGGTNLRAGLISPEGPVLWRHAVPTPQRREPERIADTIVHVLERGLKEIGADKHHLIGVGAGITGPVRREGGVALLSPNFGWRDVPFADLLRARLPAGVPVCVDNDVRVVMYGEWQFGAGRDLANFMCVTVGTGVGAALLLNGRPYYGVWDAAGEIGHYILDPQGPECGCGNRGCLEQYASASAVEREAARFGLSRGDGSPMSAAEVAAAARAGEPRAQKVLARAAAALAQGLAVSANLLSLESIIIGGGLSRAGEAFWGPLRREVARRVMPIHRRRLELVPAALGDDAGVLGAAWLAGWQSGLIHPQRYDTRMPATGKSTHGREGG